MNVYIRPYKLTAKRSANRLSRAGTKTGVHLRVKMRWTDHFADYFPHEALGDMPVELFLEKFKYQDNEYEKKVFHFLLEDERLRSQKLRPFKNHELWDGRAPITTDLIKYKLEAPDDFSFIRALEKKIRVRLDANGLFDRAGLLRFETQIPKELFSLIEYLEDPMKDPNWEGAKLPLARDFICGTPYEYLIHKPNSRFLPASDKKVIVSSYMGSDLGRWHAYCELLEKGDLNEVHGILTPGLYEEERLDLNEKSSIEALYKDLHAGEWKVLCSI